MSRRLNITLPDDTIRVLDNVAPRGNRSRVISEAVMHYISCRAKNNLAEQMRRGYAENAERDLQIAQEWYPVEEETWQTSVRHRENRKA